MKTFTLAWIFFPTNLKELAISGLIWSLFWSFTLDLVDFFQPLIEWVYGWFRSLPDLRYMFLVWSYRQLSCQYASASGQRGQKYDRTAVCRRKINHSLFITFTYRYFVNVSFSDYPEYPLPETTDGDITVHTFSITVDFVPKCLHAKSGYSYRFFKNYFNNEIIYNLTIGTFHTVVVLWCDLE